MRFCFTNFGSGKSKHEFDLGFKKLLWLKSKRRAETNVVLECNTLSSDICYSLLMRWIFSKL